MPKIIPVIIAIIHKNNKFLLTERADGPIWHFPGGGLEFGEELPTGLKREIKEELNISITIERQLPYIFSAVRSSWHGVLISYLCTISGSEVITLNEESIRYGWFTLEEIKKLKKLELVWDMAEEAAKLLTR